MKAYFTLVTYAYLPSVGGSSDIATTGPTTAQAQAKLVCALVVKAQVPGINRFFHWVGWEEDRNIKFLSHIGSPGAWVTLQV